MTEVLQEFENYLLNEKQASKNTFLSYIRDLTQFEQRLSDEYSSDLLHATEEQVDEYLQELEKIGKATTTVMRTIAAFKCFYNHQVLNGVLDSSPVRNERPKHHTETRVPEILTAEEIDLLLSQPKCVDVKGYRDKAMLELLYATGIRVSELIALDISDVNVEMGFIRCRNEGNERMIPLYTNAVDAIKVYVNRARKVMIRTPEETSLFVNVNGERMTRQGFWKIIKYYAAMAKIDKDITPHTLRHSFAVHLLENGVDVKSLQQMMGHADISSTMLYANMLKGKLKDTYDRYHPKA